MVKRPPLHIIRGFLQTVSMHMCIFINLAVNKSVCYIVLLFALSEAGDVLLLREVQYAKWGHELLRMAPKVQFQGNIFHT